LLNSLKNLGLKITSTENLSVIVFKNKSFIKISKDYVKVYESETSENYPTISIMKVAFFNNSNWNIEVDSEENEDEDRDEDIIFNLFPVDDNGNKIDKYEFTFTSNEFDLKKIIDKDLDEDNNKLIEFSNVIDFIKNEIERLNPNKEVYFN